MYLGPLSGTDASCYRVEWSPAINLFYSPKQDGCMQAAHRQWLWEWTVLAPKLCLGIVLESIICPGPKMCQGSFQQFNATGNCSPEYTFIHWHYSTCYLLLGRTTEYICEGWACFFLYIHTYKMPTKMLQGTGRSLYQSSPGILQVNGVLV